ncbi:MAG TPA: heme exporter protein CcmB [Gammaproteobacteria bacterium]|nr:heme exporter protein CcmB [Gammaproteobacteria bacterium]
MHTISTLVCVIRYELLSAYRYKADWVNAWLFFILVVSLFPLAVTPDSALLHLIAPGLIWVAALLSMLLSLGNFLRPDYEDGSLAALLLSPHALPLLILAKTTAHWLISALPLILIAPILALTLHLSAWEIVSLLFTLLLGTPVLSLLSAIAMSLTVALRNNTVLLTLLILPWCVPVLVFGTGAVIDAGSGVSNVGALALLGAMLFLAITLAPLAAGAALKLYEY